MYGFACFSLYLCLILGGGPDIGTWAAPHIQGVVVDPNAPQEQQPLEGATTDEVIYFMTTPEGPDDRGLHSGSTGSPPGSGKWVRKPTQYPMTTDAYGPHVEPGQPTSGYGGRTTDSYVPYGSRTTPGYSRYGTTEEPMSSRTTESYVPYGSRTTQGYSRYRTEEPRYGRTTEGYVPYGRRTTQGYSGYGTTEEPRFGRTTEGYVPYGRRTTPGYSRYGTTEEPEYGRTTEGYSPYGRRTTQGYSRYGTTEGIESNTDDYPTYRRTTPGPYRPQYTTADYRFGTTERMSGSAGDPNSVCQRTSASQTFQLDRNVCVEYIKCCQNFCRGKDMKPKGSCKHDTETGFDRSTTFCNCIRN